MKSMLARRTVRATILVCSLAVAPGVFAQDNAGPPDNDDTLTIGAAAAIVPTYEGSDDYRIIPGPAIRGKISGHNFYTRQSAFYFDLIPEKPGNNLDLSLGVAAGTRFSRTRGIKDPQVKLLGKLDTPIELGGFVGIAKTGVITSDYDTIGVRVSYLRDVANAHDSYVIQPAFEYGTPLSQSLYVGFDVSADYVGSSYARYYYSVSPAGTAASGLATYDLDKGWKNISTTVLANYALSGDLRTGWSVFATGSYSKMLGEFKRSPIVRDAGSANQWFGALGVAYTF
ncbi:MipA/OmpV family protein [Sphingobium boeckii]|uniref:Outer membrane scaffolding protein for murein synthesis (MipA/OmpV family) n=1 Tax=Sphingobium boeckii TaxID=1082345 RepID=A0A7W9EE64_9SPHN|nr:MipA/OmpV family protein [Sphingobium boeckii]MBB5684665.1 outer membrane scaffolding protein for murein synthesis (MipA/OmpV family) [Sphingobium boeckii]